MDIGCNGQVSDGGVFKNSALFSALEKKTLNIRTPRPIVRQHRAIPYMIVADDAFPLKEYMLKPYSQVGLTIEKRIFNYMILCHHAWVDQKHRHKIQ